MTAENKTRASLGRLFAQTFQSLKGGWLSPSSSASSSGDGSSDPEAAFAGGLRRAKQRHVFSGAACLIAVGDIHGRADLLERLFHKIDRMTEETRATEIYLGDYVDRGADSRRVIALLLDRRQSGKALVLLRGNHETMFLRALEDDASLLAWLNYGGLATLTSYGVNAENAFRDPASVRAALNDAMPQQHKDFLQNLPLFYRDGEFLFVHAGIRPNVPLDHQTETDLTTIREPFLSSSEDFGFVVVHGHTPGEYPVLRDNRIGLDTGAFHTSRLTAIKLGPTGLDLITALPN